MAGWAGWVSQHGDGLRDTPIHSTAALTCSCHAASAAPLENSELIWRGETLPPIRFLSLQSKKRRSSALVSDISDEVGGPIIYHVSCISDGDGPEIF